MVLTLFYLVTILLKGTVLFRYVEYITRYFLLYFSEENSLRYHGNWEFKLWIKKNLFLAKNCIIWDMYIMNLIYPNWIIPTSVWLINYSPSTLDHFFFITSHISPMFLFKVALWFLVTSECCSLCRENLLYLFFLWKTNHKTH